MEWNGLRDAAAVACKSFKTVLMTRAAGGVAAAAAPEEVEVSRKDKAALHTFANLSHAMVCFFSLSCSVSGLRHFT